ncbi:hypothetical protein P4O66_012198 [Electrophorus voltai]|uniref:Uncharacterized protein n=2 Tax=Electrophorus TaxID=8004 RepID=A0A4W4F560_ELEEL|nr:coiled-coil domain-containing protein 117 [Electrophorus electricus]KAK1792246.1 hypothetical protein P4O66_012198 [Electrophorus voltai]
MHSASAGSSDLGYLPSTYGTLPHLTVPDMGVSKGHPSGSRHLTGTNSSWDRRCQRKHRRRTDDEGCSAKRQKLMEVVGSDPLENMCHKASQGWKVEGTSCSPSSQPSPTALMSGHSTQDMGQAFPSVSLAPARLENEGCCMEVEAAQRKLQEIEDRITLEDDSDEDLDVEPVHRRPVLVLSDSLREGLQRGLCDILPHTVAQSVSRSCMELVLWRPLEDPVTQQLKDSLQRQQRKYPVCRQTPTPTPTSSTPLSEQPQPKRSVEQSFSGPYCPLVTSSTVEEDMEL